MLHLMAEVAKAGMGHALIPLDSSGNRRLEEMGSPAGRNTEKYLT